MSIIHAEPETLALPDPDAEIPCCIVGCGSGATWAATFSICRCNYPTYCDVHKAAWDELFRLGNFTACGVHPALDQVFVDWRRL